jgi:2-polyprenyl-6-methoxyphenol hydroxylase-like FAD-dependent oxidoreductase
VVDGLRVGVVGGSIAGCATAVLLSRAGHDVTIFERSSDELVSRGAGIATTPEVLAGMVADDLIDEAFPGCPVTRVPYVCRGDGGRAGRWLGDAPFDLITLNWAHLFHNLRRRVPTSIYRNGVSVERVDASESGAATLHINDGRAESFDLVVCADGYQSLGRAAVAPDSRLSYRNMVAWRAILPEATVDVTDLAGAIIRVMFPGGYGVVYLIPGSEGATEPGRRLLTWVFFLQVPPEDLDGLLLNVDGRQQRGSVAFGMVRPELSDEFRRRLAVVLPTAVMGFIDAAPEYSIQAIYSTIVPTYHRNRVCLVGDAGSLLPPFTVSGVLKAIGNAASLKDILASATSLSEALTAWSEAQCRLAEPVVKLAEHSEAALIFDTPDLSAMSVKETNAWMTLTNSHAPVSALTLPDA